VLEENNGLLEMERKSKAAQESSYQQLVGEMKDKISALNVEISASHASMETFKASVEDERRDLVGHIDRLERQLKTAQDALSEAKKAQLNGDIVKDQKELIKELNDELTEVMRLLLYHLLPSNTVFTYYIMQCVLH